LNPVPASQLGAGDQVDWVWEGYLARGHHSLVVGFWKAGKTTLLAHLLKLMGSGGKLITNVVATKVLVITEEGRGLWAKRRDEIGLGDHVEFLVRPFKGRPSRTEWLGFVATVGDLVQSRGYGLVVFDTFASVNPASDENDAAGMMAALMPLHRLAEAGAAVLLLHHPRKGDGTEGQASRGSGALPGFVDVIVEFRRYDPAQRDDRRRVLEAFSRFDETPTEEVIELTDDGYAGVGQKSDAKRGDRSIVIREILDAHPDGLTTKDLRDKWPQDGIPKPGESTLAADLEAGNGTSWDRQGKGTKGDPYVWIRFFHGPPPIGGRNESGREVTDL
jgi:hypothetical protein